MKLVVSRRNQLGGSSWKAHLAVCVMLATLISIAGVTISASEYGFPTCQATSDLESDAVAVTGRVLTSGDPAESIRVHVVSSDRVICVTTAADGVFRVPADGLAGDLLVIVDPPDGGEDLSASSRSVTLHGSDSPIDLGDFNLEVEDSLMVESLSDSGPKLIVACLLHLDSSTLQCSSSGVTAETSHEFRIARPASSADGGVIAYGQLYLADGSRRTVISGGPDLPLLLDFTTTDAGEVEPEIAAADGCVPGMTPNATGTVTIDGEPYANATVAAVVDELGQIEMRTPHLFATTNADGEFSMCVQVAFGGDLYVRFVAYSKDVGPGSTVGDTFSEWLPITNGINLPRVCEVCSDLTIEMSPPTLRGAVSDAAVLALWGEQRLRVDDLGNFAVAYSMPVGTSLFLDVLPAEPPSRFESAPHVGVPVIAALRVPVASIPLDDDGYRTFEAELPAANFRLGFLAPSGDRVVAGQTGWSRVEMYAVDSLTCPSGGYGYMAEDVVPVHNVVLGAAAAVQSGTYNLRAQGELVSGWFTECAGVSFVDGLVVAATSNLSYSDGIWWMQVREEFIYDDSPPSTDGGVGGGAPVGGPPGDGPPSGAGSPVASGSPMAAVVQRPTSPTMPVSASFSVPAGRLEVRLTGLTAAAEAKVTVIQAPEASGVKFLPTAFDVDVVTSGRLLQAELCVPIDSGEVAAAGVDPQRLSIYHFDPGPVDITTRSTATQVCGVTSSFSPFAVGVPASSRIAGADRYGTAADLVAAAFPGVADLVLVATGANFPDALSASAAAAKAGAPLLLVSPREIPAATRDQLIRLRPKHIVVVGGAAAVSAAVERDLGRIAPVERIAGLNRFDTAALLASRFFDATTTEAYLVNGNNFPDALAAGAASSYVGRPVLLTDATSLPEATSAALRDLGISGVTVVGGERAVSQTVFAQTSARVAQVRRIAGQDRYDTAARLANSLAARGSNILLATGTNFPDALGAAAVAARLDSTLILTSPTTASRAAMDYLGRNSPGSITVLGGYNAVSRNTESQFATSYLR